MSPAVRNLKSIGGIPVHVYIPPIFNPIHKIEVTNGTTTYDVTDYVTGGEYTYGVTETIGSFTFTIDNSTEGYTSVFNLWNEVKVYLDYGTSATTLKFLGRIERASKSNSAITITGRGPGVITIGKNVTYSTVDTARSTALTEIIEKYFDITTSNIETDSGLISVDYIDLPFWEVVEDLCSRGGFDAYVDPTYDFHYFESGSRENATEVVVHTYNLIETGDFSQDLEQVYNKIKVYGSNIGNIPIIAVSEDDSSQESYTIRELKIDDGSITTVEQAQARADYELSLQNSPPTIGTVLSLGLPTISPGEMIRISDPMNGLAPNLYQIQKYTHKFSNDEPFQTELTVQKERLDIPNILKKRIKIEREITMNINPNEMDYSLIYNFSDDSGTFVDTERNLVSSGEGYYELKTTSGNESGSWTSPVYNLPSNISAIEFRISGENLVGTPPEGTKIQYSFDGGNTFYTYGTTSIVPSGDTLNIKINLSSSSTKIKSVGALYKL